MGDDIVFENSDPVSASESGITCDCCGGTKYDTITFTPCKNISRSLCLMCIVQKIDKAFNLSKDLEMERVIYETSTDI